MQYALLVAVTLLPHLAAAQSGSLPLPLPALPATSLQTVMSATAVPSTPGVRYQYQQVHLDNHRIWLAPAWRGATKREPARRLFNFDAVGELDGLLLQTINELAANGWDLLEIRTLSRPVEAVQKLERELPFNDPERPVYKGTTSIITSSQTRYLFRKALVN